MKARKFWMGLMAAGMALMLSGGANAQVMTPGRAHIYPAIDAAPATVEARRWRLP